MHKLATAVISSAVLSLVLAIGCGEGGGDMQILSIDPPNGATQGEQPVKIGGQNFRTDIGYTVFFGTKRAGQVTIIDPETLLVVTPPYETAGNVDITIRADNGDAFRIHEAFEYQEVAGGIIDRMGDGPEKNDMGALAY